MLKGKHDQFEWDQRFFHCFDYRVRNAISELVRGIPVNPYNKEIRQVLGSYVKSGLIFKCGNRYPNTNYILNIENPKFELWIRASANWKKYIDNLPENILNIKITNRRIDLLEETFINTKSASRKKYYTELKIIECIRFPFVKSEQRLPKKYFDKIAILNEVYYTINESGVNLYVDMYSYYYSMMATNLKNKLIERRKDRNRNIARSKTKKEIDILLRNIGFPKKLKYLEEFLPSEMASKQAKWECFCALKRVIFVTKDEEKFARLFSVRDTTIRAALRVASQPPPIECFFSDQKEHRRLSLILPRKIERTLET